MISFKSCYKSDRRSVIHFERNLCDLFANLKKKIDSFEIQRQKRLFKDVSQIVIFNFMHENFMAASKQRDASNRKEKIDLHMYKPFVWLAKMREHIFKRIDKIVLKGIHEKENRATSFRNVKYANGIFITFTRQDKLNSRIDALFFYVCMAVCVCVFLKWNVRFRVNLST